MDHLEKDQLQYPQKASWSLNARSKRASCLPPTRESRMSATKNEKKGSDSRTVEPDDLTDALPTYGNKKGAPRSANQKTGQKLRDRNL